ncbi:hypothetical protein EAI_05910 [Harpegnathos saltator]|uniref:Uncharacterized protein n=1 Tax=Harpegnathos saltator TaxID=610380 RepID=E2C499_HARSA|nr:hypothetical protein EAI_05910 [Harpegnathos saltator]
MHPMAPDKLRHVHMPFSSYDQSKKLNMKEPHPTTTEANKRHLWDWFFFYEEQFLLASFI